MYNYQEPFYSIAYILQADFLAVDFTEDSACSNP